ncbi:hypothetical protein HDK64DRAFT_138881 [Phyllosticta capitalensis]
MGFAKHITRIPGRARRRPLLSITCGVVDRAAGPDPFRASRRNELRCFRDHLLRAVQLSRCRWTLHLHQGQCLSSRQTSLCNWPLLRYLRAARSCLRSTPSQSQDAKAAAMHGDGRCSLAWNHHMRPPPTLVGDRRSCRAHYCPERCRKT